MKTREEPVALWKGIVGTAVSGFALLIIFLVFIFLYVLNKVLPDWAIIIIFVGFVIVMITLFISIGNIQGAVEYKRTLEELENAHHKKDNNTKSELLHKLLSEGKITIEEYDELNK